MRRIAILVSLSLFSSAVSAAKGGAPPSKAAATPTAESTALTIHSKGRGSLAVEIRDAVGRMSAGGDTRLALGPSSGQVECFDLTDVSDVVVCVFNTARFMNFALNRASEFVEVSKGHVLSDREHAENRLNDSVEGHDLIGADLRAFDKAWVAARRSFERVTEEDSLAKLALERDFWDRFLRPKLAKSPDLILLAVAAGTDVEGTISHEILHAQYFRSAGMRRVASEYWETSVPDADKKAITSVLRANYAVDGDRELLINEFQAYVLMHRAEDFQLASAVATHRAPLLERLAKVGIAPIQFRLRE